MENIKNILQKFEIESTKRQFAKLLAELYINLRKKSILSYWFSEYADVVFVMSFIITLPSKPAFTETQFPNM